MHGSAVIDAEFPQKTPHLLTGGIPLSPGPVAEPLACDADKKN